MEMNTPNTTTTAARVWEPGFTGGISREVGVGGKRKVPGQPPLKIPSGFPSGIASGPPCGLSHGRVDSPKKQPAPGR